MTSSPPPPPLQGQPIETAPKQRVILLWALTDAATSNYKMATGNWFPGYGDESGGWEWDGRRLKDYDYLEERFDTVDGPDGQSKPNAAMNLHSLLCSALGELP